MALMWKQVADLARKQLGMDEVPFRALLLERGVSSQTVTNWKKMGRPIPPGRYAFFAEILKMSIDDLVGRAGAHAARDSTLVYPNSDAEAKLLAAEISELTPDWREVLTAVVNVLVAKKKNAEKEANATKTGKTGSKSKNKPSPRADA